MNCMTPGARLAWMAAGSAGSIISVGLASLCLGEMQLRGAKAEAASLGMTVESAAWARPPGAAAGKELIAAARRLPAVTPYDRRSRQPAQGVGIDLDSTFRWADQNLELVAKLEEIAGHKPDLPGAPSGLWPQEVQRVSRACSLLAILMHRDFIEGRLEDAERRGRAALSLVASLHRTGSLSGASAARWRAHSIIRLALLGASSEGSTEAKAAAERIIRQVQPVPSVREITRTEAVAALADAGRYRLDLALFRQAEAALQGRRPPAGSEVVIAAGDSLKARSLRRLTLGVEAERRSKTLPEALAAVRAAEEEWRGDRVWDDQRAIGLAWSLQSEISLLAVRDAALWTLARAQGRKAPPPVDPFTGARMGVYDAPGRWKAFSVGPDLKDEGGEIGLRRLQGGRDVGAEWPPLASLQIP